jgi:peptide-methionine (S)-S-oxide reductase
MTTSEIFDLAAPPEPQGKGELATFGAGCFWGAQEAYRQLPGVLATSVGYMGGDFEHPCHLDVAARITGHAEVVQVTYNPEAIAYGVLLEKFWQIHDPTSLNRQGPDRGEQYRSVIFYHSPEQGHQARRARDQQASCYEKPIVTQILPAKPYWLAAEEHQQYLAKRLSRVSG